jgi:[acyl-carrier-protein] S-malonyltransferase
MYGFVFPGQGSQQVGMGKFLYDNFKSVTHLFEEASDTLNKNYKKLIFDDPKDELNLTQYTQPALVLTSSAYFKVLSEIKEIKIKSFAGHSIGEYSATVAAQSLSLSSALLAVEKRGQWMQEAVPIGEGGMAALLGFSEAEVFAICQWAEKETGLSPVSPANFNAPGQIVISGKAKLIQYILDNLNKENWPKISSEEPPRRMKALPLKVSAPFHCELMKPAEEKMAFLLRDLEFNTAIAPIIQNVDAKAHTNAKEICENLIQQISAPVLWTKCMDTFSTQNIDTLVECGHGQVLSGLTKKMNHDFKSISFKNLEDLKQFEKGKYEKKEKDKEDA